MTNKNKIGVFLDRDGVINKEVDLLHQIEQLKLFPYAGEAIKKLKEEELKVIIITNQSVVARGLCTEKELEDIHQELKERLKRQGGEIDRIYYCPHHKEADLQEYRKKCDNRKPASGFTKKAAREFDLNLKSSYFVGDRTEDIKAGNEAGCKTILVKTGYGGQDKKYEVTPNFTCSNLLEAVNLILNKT